ncbi:MAG: hypothetical protein V5A23_03120 [Halobacteriales archaeon]
MVGYGSHPDHVEPEPLGQQDRRAAPAAPDVEQPGARHRRKGVGEGLPDHVREPSLGGPEQGRLESTGVSEVEIRVGVDRQVEQSPDVRPVAAPGA